MSSMSRRRSKMLNWLVGAWIMVVLMEQCNLASATGLSGEEKEELMREMLSANLKVGGTKTAHAGQGDSMFEVMVGSFEDKMLKSLLTEGKELYLSILHAEFKKTLAKEEGERVRILYKKRLFVVVVRSGRQQEAEKFAKWLVIGSWKLVFTMEGEKVEIEELLGRMEREWVECEGEKRRVHEHAFGRAGNVFAFAIVPTVKEQMFEHPERLASLLYTYGRN